MFTKNDVTKGQFCCDLIFAENSAKKAVSEVNLYI